MNTEGRPQFAESVVDGLGAAKNDWEIFRALSEELGRSLMYDSIVEVRMRGFCLSPYLRKTGDLESLDRKSVV